MWYDKNLQIDNISKMIEDKGFSGIGKKVMEFLISNHCSLHHVNYKDKQKIERIFGIPQQSLLLKRGNRK